MRGADAGPIAVGLFCLIMLAVGFARGEMPLGVLVDADRHNDPRTFWAIAGFYIAVLAISAVLAATHALS